MTDSWIRPERALMVLAAVYAAWQAVTGLGLLAVAWRHVDDMMLLWSALGLVFGVPLVLLLAVLGSRMEGAAHGQRPPASWLWCGVALGIVASAHWIAVASWPLGLIGLAVLQGSQEAVERVGIGLGVLLPPVVGLGVGMLASRARDRRVWPDVGRPVRRSWVPVSGLLGAAYTCCCASAAVLGMGWLASEDSAASSGLPAVAAWVLAGAGASVGAAGLTELWRRATVIGQQAPEHARLQVAGGVLAAHWVPVFALALTPLASDDPDLRWSLILAGFVLILLGTWLWGLGHASEMPTRRLAPAP